MLNSAASRLYKNRRLHSHLPNCQQHTEPLLPVLLARSKGHIPDIFTLVTIMHASYPKQCTPDRDPIQFSDLFIYGDTSLAMRIRQDRDLNRRMEMTKRASRISDCDSGSVSRMTD